MGVNLGEIMPRSRRDRAEIAPGWTGEAAAAALLWIIYGHRFRRRVHTLVSAYYSNLSNATYYSNSPEATYPKLLTTPTYPKLLTLVSAESIKFDVSVGWRSFGLYGAGWRLSSTDQSISSKKGCD